jgi:hypothetical protein
LLELLHPVRQLGDTQHGHRIVCSGALFCQDHVTSRIPHRIANLSVREYALGPTSVHKEQNLFVYNVISGAVVPYDRIEVNIPITVLARFS